MVDVPVVAHRLFGTKYIRRKDDPRTAGRGRIGFGIAPFRRGPALSDDLSAWFDWEHGTKRSKELIRAFFADVPSLPHTAGWSVNTLWAPSSISFTLVDVLDQMIDSEKADFMPRGDEQPEWSRFNRRGAINVYFCLEIEGAAGIGESEPHPNRFRVPKGRVLMADALPGYSSEDSWRYDVIILAHELGHALTLPHKANEANLMFPWATRDTGELTPTQRLVAWQHAWKYSNLSSIGESALRTMDGLRRLIVSPR